MGEIHGHRLLHSQALPTRSASNGTKKNKGKTEVRRWRCNQTDVSRTWKESVHPASPIQLVMSLVVGCCNFVFSGLFLCLCESSPVQSSPVQSSSVQFSSVQFSPLQFSSVQFSPLQSSDQWHHYFQPPQWEIHFMYLVPRKFFNHAMQILFITKFSKNLCKWLLFRRRLSMNGKSWVTCIDTVKSIIFSCVTKQG